MFLREVKRQNRNGTQVSYLQLVHNDWDAAARTSRTKILYSFGRTDQLATRRGSAPFERVLFGLVANRALAPSSKLAAADRICNDVHIA
ncbi:MAG: hypothetical protein ACRDRH_13225, partial [Pseudonocardia sp.]